MKRISLALCFSVLCVGCGETDAPLEAVDATITVGSPEELRLSAVLAITEKPLTEPLTDEEIQAFIDLVKVLPDRKPPVFSPVSSAAKVQGLRLDAAVKAWRGAVRKSLTTDTLMKGWSPRPPLRRALDERQVAARSLTSLMLRLSCSLGVDAMGGRRDVAAQRVIADEKIDSIIARIQQLDRSRQPIPNSVWEGLEEATSLAEYLAVLTTLPAENQLVLNEHKAELQAILPMSTGVTQPKESREESHVIPVRYEDLSNEPSTPAPARKSSQKKLRTSQIQD